ncbi:N-acetyldiaminopimelate deacetylase [Clarias magur]|uniref:N-acetyldiaminopimelate deacetylase n=1 Tax=Clarias magur TaxID=1594786 RepID=A0A8J4XFF7_CLAMG|nr:N-acetyldiaminopimelate deacetylase [Clarias magur]
MSLSFLAFLLERATAAHSANRPLNVTGLCGERGNTRQKWGWALVSEKINRLVNRGLAGRLPLSLSPCTPAPSIIEALLFPSSKTTSLPFGMVHPWIMHNCISHPLRLSAAPATQHTGASCVCVSLEKDRVKREKDCNSLAMNIWASESSHTMATADAVATEIHPHKRLE